MLLTLAMSADTARTTKSDLIVSDWWAQQFVNFTPQNIALVLMFSLIAGVIISLVYKRTYRGVLYNPSFSTTLILLTLVTAPVVMTIGSNVALSMGMVGALSIVRFRTAVKNPIDTAYMFWAITMGILIGSGSYIISLVVVAGISVIMLALSFVRLRSSENYLLVLHYDPVAEQEIDAELHRSVRTYRVRSKTVTRAGAEMTVDLRLYHRTDIVGHMLDIAGVHDATLVSCQNEASV
ncbi:MAG: DUF4956 domain-containing protein [Clostridiales bacterium]|jgi:uncharacterized membrane protein YhiD involved in acid resistance|nr:DUF4956 domain-containing protein [Clostridiales bacterium]